MLLAEKNENQTLPSNPGLWYNGTMHRGKK